MSKLSGYLFLSAFLGVLGFFLPWFHPVHPGVVSNSWNAWDSDFGFVPGIVALLAGALAIVLRIEETGRTSLDVETVGTMMERFLWIPLVGLAACIWSWVRLPHDDVLQTCFGSVCGGDDASWVNDDGASRGTQIGFWFSVISCVIALLCAITLFGLRDQITDQLVDNRFPDDTPPLPVARPTGIRTALSSYPQRCIAVPPHAENSSAGHCSVCFPNAVAPASVGGAPAAPGCIAHPPHPAPAGNASTSCGTCFPATARPEPAA